MDRRRFVAITGSTLAALPQGWAQPWTLVPEGKLAAAADGGSVDGEIVAALERRLADLWRFDDGFGGLTSARLADADLSLALTLLRRGNYGADIERGLLSVAGGCAGWPGSRASTRPGIRPPTAIGTPGSGCVTERGTGSAPPTSWTTWHYSSAGPGQAGRRSRRSTRPGRAAGPGAPDAVHAMLDMSQVSAHAALGEAEDAVRMLGRADERWDSRDPEETPGWAYWLSRPSEITNANRALVEAGRPEVARANMSARVAREDGGYVRSRARALTIVADAELAQGSLESALDAAGSAADALRHVESARASQELTRFAGRLPEREPAAREFRERLREQRIAA